MSSDTPEMPDSAPLSEPTGLVPSVYPEDYVPNVDWTPSPEERNRLRYWDFFIYWVDYAGKKQRGETTEAPGFRRNR